MSGETRVTAGVARETATTWLNAEAPALHGFVGAYTVGSVNELSDDEPLPVTSDLDVMVVLDRPDAPPKAGKLYVDGTLLEITYLAWGHVRDPRAVLGHYHLAPGMAGARVLLDPSCRLGQVVAAVRAGYADTPWIRRRCEMARKTVVDRLDSIDLKAPAHERAMPWLFATGGLPHILLVAGLQNPTVRRRYEAAAYLIDELGFTGRNPDLLELAGLGDLSPRRVTRYLEAMQEVFDEATAARRTPFPYASDISPEARPLVVNGSQEMIVRERHREAMFWIAVTFTRCMHILHTDASVAAARWEAPYSALLHDLGVLDPGAMGRSAQRIRDELPHVTALAGEFVRVVSSPGRRQSAGFRTLPE